MNTKPLSKNDGIKNEQLIINSINNKKGDTDSNSDKNEEE